MYIINRNTKYVDVFRQRNSVGYELALGVENDLLNNATDRWRTTFSTYFLNPNIDMIPIVCLGNPRENSRFKSLQDFSQVLRSRVSRDITSGYYYGGFNLDDEQVAEIDKAAKQIYYSIVKERDNSYSRNIPVTGRRLNANSQLRKLDLPEIFTGLDYSTMISFGSPVQRNLMTFFYYTDEGKIISTLMIKKDKISEFKEDFINGIVNPENVEIWLDKGVIENKDRKAFHKWLRETFIVKYTMMGFNIKLVDDIISVLSEVPTLKFKTLEEFKTFKVELNNFLLNAS